MFDLAKHTNTSAASARSKSGMYACNCLTLVAGRPLAPYPPTRHMAGGCVQWMRVAGTGGSAGGLQGRARALAGGSQHSGSINVQPLRVCRTGGSGRVHGRRPKPQAERENQKELLGKGCVHVQPLKACLASSPPCHPDFFPVVPCPALPCHRTCNGGLSIAAPTVHLAHQLRCHLLGAAGAYL